MKIPLREIVFRMNRLDVIRRIHINRAAAASELHFGQLPILEFVENHDRCTQCEVAEKMRVSPPSIATSVKRMQKAGMIRKIPDENDLRYNRLSITEKGKEQAALCRSGFNQVDRRMFEGFSEKEIELFREFLDRMTANLSDDELKEQSTFALMEQEKKMMIQAEQRARQQKGEEKRHDS